MDNNYNLAAMWWWGFSAMHKFGAWKTAGWVIICAIGSESTIV